MAQLKLSGGANNTLEVFSLGGAMSSKIITTATIENLFDDVNRVEIINGRIEYRLFYLENESATDYYRTNGITIVIPADTEIAFGVDNRNGDVPQQLSTEDQTPTDVTFFDVDDYVGLRIPIGAFDQNDAIPIWIRRKVNLGAKTVRTISLDFDAETNSLTITQDFSSVHSSTDNFNITSRSPLFYTDIDFVGESLLS
jgi:hypothetical protein